MYTYINNLERWKPHLPEPALIRCHHACRRLRVPLPLPLPLPLSHSLFGLPHQGTQALARRATPLSASLPSGRIVCADSGRAAQAAGAAVGFSTLRTHVCFVYVCMHMHACIQARLVRPCPCATLCSLMRASTPARACPCMSALAHLLSWSLYNSAQTLRRDPMRGQRGSETQHL